MPTTLPRTSITHVPRVQRILNAGRRRWPGKPDKDILIDLAEERLADLGIDPPGTRNGIPLLTHTRPGVLTTQMVQDILNADD